jgi:hypothetical protein
MIPDGGVRALTLQRRFPSSLLRIISSRRLLQDGGLLHFFDTDAALPYARFISRWKYRFSSDQRSQATLSSMARCFAPPPM